MALKPITERRTINNIVSISGSNDVVLVENNSNNVLGSFYFGGDDHSATKKFIKSVEKSIRISQEYSRYLKYLTDKGLVNDVIFGNINNEDATTEFHHYPFTLYDITEIMLNYCLKNKIKITSLTLAEKVMKLHYDNVVGLVKLSKTSHELTHAGEIFIPMNSVFGDVNKFVEKYREYIFQDQIEIYNKLIEIDNKKEYDNKLYSDDSINSSSFIGEVLE